MNTHTYMFTHPKRNQNTLGHPRLRLPGHSARAPPGRRAGKRAVQRHARRGALASVRDGAGAFVARLSFLCGRLIVWMRVYVCID